MERKITSVDLFTKWILQCALCLFTKILKAIYATHREKGHLNEGYIEDSYPQGGMIRECQSNVADTCYYLQD